MKDKRVDEVLPAVRETADQVKKFDQILPTVEELMELPQKFEEFSIAVAQDFTKFQTTIEDLVKQILTKVDKQDESLAEMIETLGLEVDALGVDRNAVMESLKEVQSHNKDLDKALTGLVDRIRRATDPLKMWSDSEESQSRHSA